MKNPVMASMSPGDFGPEAQEAEIPQGEFPANFDWRKHNAVTEVKNQVCAPASTQSANGVVHLQI